MSVQIAPDRLDSEKLLSPIPGAQPAGEFLLHEGTYQSIREARREDDPSLTQGIYKTDLKKADWKTVERICSETLERRSKDVQIAAWLMEAWMHLYGFAGCRAGLQLLTDLMEMYWEHLHPQLNEGDPEDRVGTFVWINEKLSVQLKLIPLTAPQSTNDLLPYSFADWKSACRLEESAERNPKALSAAESNGQATLARFKASAMFTPTPFYVELSDELGGSRDACRALDELLEEKFGEHSPGLQRFKETLAPIQHLVNDILQTRPDNPSLAAPEEETQSVAAAETHDAAAEIWTTQPIRSRTEAYWRLTEAAEYLLRTEPHSPTPYLVKRAVEWGSMSLFEVFQQIIRNEGEMQEINRLLKLTHKEEGG
jgi:type VI secretion system ImpA family protein